MADKRPRSVSETSGGSTRSSARQAAAAEAAAGGGGGGDGGGGGGAPAPKAPIRGPSYPKLPPNVPRDAVQATYFEPYRFLLVRLAAHAHFMSGGAIRWETVGAPLPRPLSRSSWT